MFLADKWSDYTLIDAADGEKLEYWGKYLLRRPDPLAAWSEKSEKSCGRKPTRRITARPRAAVNGNISIKKSPSAGKSATAI